MSCLDVIDRYDLGCCVDALERVTIDPKNRLDFWFGGLVGVL
jgi:hypothetical protein